MIVVDDRMIHDFLTHDVCSAKFSTRLFRDSAVSRIALSPHLRSMTDKQSQQLRRNKTRGYISPISPVALDERSLLASLWFQIHSKVHGNPGLRQIGDVQGAARYFTHFQTLLKSELEEISGSCLRSKSSL